MRANQTNLVVQPGSIGAIAQQQGRSIAESFVGADVITIVDTSGSMASGDSRDGLSRYEVANQELANLQRSLPGKIAVVSFSNDVQFCPGGVPVFFNGGTDLVKALVFCKIADVPDMRFILISDGEPDNPEKCIDIARTYKNRIDVIYVGPEKLPAGREFLNRLAKATGGKTVTADRAVALESSVMQLLGSGR